MRGRMRDAGSGTGRRPSSRPDRPLPGFPGPLVRAIAPTGSRRAPTGEALARSPERRVATGEALARIAERLDEDGNFEFILDENGISVETRRVPE